MAEVWKKNIYSQDVAPVSQDAVSVRELEPIFSERWNPKPEVCAVTRT